MERIQPRSRKITRNRELRACTECRKRKLRCDCHIPCTACIRRNEATSCVYERKSDGRQFQAEAKLQHLEQLVKELSQSRQSFESAEDKISASSGLRLEKDEPLNQALHKGATYWGAMLEDIDELRAVINDNDEVDEGSIDRGADEDGGIGLLFGATEPFTFREVIVRFLPPRLQVDRLTAAYFKSKTVKALFIHTKLFSRLYKLFWESPTDASPLWTSILFSILHISKRTMSTDHEASVGERLDDDSLARAAAHCLAIGHYYKPQKFAVEALALHCQSRCLTSVHIPSDLAILVGALIRLATVMGYHKDIDTTQAGISVFEMEIRRRTWSSCMQLDILVSFQLGLPSNVQYPTWDSKPPAYLLDSDFDEDTVQLPLGRPATEPTELLFYIAKHNFMAIFEKILRHTLSITDAPTNQIETIEQELRNTYTALPAVFKPRTLADSMFDAPSVVISRVCVRFVYQKCLCVLHRKYVVLGRQQSIQVCHDSASELLRQFLDIYEEFQPGGQLETERWFMSSITWHDFMLGCAALCLTLCSTAKSFTGLNNTTIIDMMGSLELLKGAEAICANQPSKSRDTRKVERLLKATILKFSNQYTDTTSAIQPLLPNTGDFISGAPWEVVESAPDDQGWSWNETIIKTQQDPTWAYMEQFLDLSDEEPLTNS
jgi:hypothetical protein